MATAPSIPEIREPRTYAEAVGDPHYGKQWEAAIRDELNVLIANGTWRLEKLPADRKAITSKWVFKVKRHADGSVDRLKARVVARGFTQQYGVDYNETFAPMVRMASVRFQLAIAAQKKLVVHSVDVVSAYLAGDLDEDLYMVPPEGYDGEDKLCKLLKSIYGLKQSARVWNHKLRNHLVANGYKQLHSDYGLYFNGVVLIAAYVDDMAIAGPADLKAINEAKEMLRGEFDIKDLGLCQ
jgi:hypothetical protein